MDLTPKVPQCSPYCHNYEHAQDIIAVITKGTPHQIKLFLEEKCSNGAQVSDCYGRNALHMSASCGKWEIVDWLITEKHVELKSKDLESGWTALHRSLFYGQINSSVYLTRHGSDLYKKDREGHTPLDLVIKDQPCFVEYNACGPTQCYTWGANANFTLGFSNQHSRNHPELVEELVRNGYSIKQIVMCKFHTIFLTHCGVVLCCGYGQGGRLGLGDEQTYLLPHLIEGLVGMKCLQIAAGRDHIVFLLESGAVYTCGQNDYHQLGLSLGITCYNPKPISLKILKGKAILGIAAGRFHTVLHSHDAVYTFGLNAGQLGHPKGDKFQLSPRQVTSLHHKDFRICALGTSDAATICATTKGDIYVLHEYLCRKIASKCLNIKKLVVFGGHLDADVEQNMLKDQGGEQLQVVALNVTGTVFMWRACDKYLKRCTWDVKCQLFMSDIAIHRHSMIFSTMEGQGFLGFLSKKSNTIREISPRSPTTPDTFSCSTRVKQMEKEEVELIHLQRIPFVHRAVQVACDKSGQNFAVLQSDPKTSLVEVPVVSSSEMMQHFAALLKEADLNDNIHDVTLKVGSRLFPAHKYILSARSEYFIKLFRPPEQESNDGNVERDSNSDPSSANEIINLGDMVECPILELLLQYIYEDQCDLFKSGYQYTLSVSNIEQEKHCLETQDYVEKIHTRSAYVVNQELKKATKIKGKERKKKKVPTATLR